MYNLGIDRSDRTYIRLRKMALETLLARGVQTTDLSDEELVSLWEEALAEAQERYKEAAAGPAIGVVSMHVAYPGNALAWSYYDKPGYATWNSFGREVIDSSLPCQFEIFCHRPLQSSIETLQLWLDFDLDNDAVTGAFEGTLEGNINGFGGEELGEASGTFQGQITGGQMRYDSAGGAWDFDGAGWVEVEMKGSGLCCPNCSCDKTGALENVSIAGEGSQQIPVTLSGSTLGRPTLRISGEHCYGADGRCWRFSIACLECSLPVDLPAR
jgi:hypothetical protein